MSNYVLIIKISDLIAYENIYKYMNAILEYITVKFIL